MAYDRKKVDWTDSEHKQAEKLDGAGEKLILAFSDGFQPLQDGLEVIDMGFAFADVIRVATQEFFAREGRRPHFREIAAVVLERAVMLERDNRYVRKSLGRSSND